MSKQKFRHLRKRGAKHKESEELGSLLCFFSVFSFFTPLALSFSVFPFSFLSFFLSLFLFLSLSISLFFSLSCFLYFLFLYFPFFLSFSFCFSLASSFFFNFYTWFCRAPKVLRIYHHKRTRRTKGRRFLVGASARSVCCRWLRYLWFYLRSGKLGEHTITAYDIPAP